jgi:hypothetical protein
MSLRIKANLQQINSDYAINLCYGMELTLRHIIR